MHTRSALHRLQLAGRQQECQNKSGAEAMEEGGERRAGRTCRMCCSSDLPARSAVRKRQRARPGCCSLYHRCQSNACKSSRTFELSLRYAQALAGQKGIYRAFHTVSPWAGRDGVQVRYEQASWEVIAQHGTGSDR